MNERCLDASVVLKLVLKGEAHRSTARRLIRDSVAAGIALIAPPFFPFEIDSAICRRVRDGVFTSADAQDAYRLLDATPIQVVMHPDLRQRARQMAEHFGERTVYDASYAALAELRGCEFWTADKPFYDTVKAELAFVHYLPDYS